MVGPKDLGQSEERLREKAEISVQKGERYDSEPLTNHQPDTENEDVLRQMVPDSCN